MTNLRDKVALVTGGSRGIGKAIVRELAARGARVVMNYRSDDAAVLETVEVLAAQGLRVLPRRADVSNEEDRAQLFRWIGAQFGGLDVLVNCAGITRDELFMMMRAESWSRVLETNLTGTVRCAELALASMQRRGGGLIVNIGSGACFGPRPAQANYAASKAALIGLTKSLAREAAGSGVRVVLVAPGFTATDMSAAVQHESARASLGLIPLRRWGTPEEIADVVGFMTCDTARQLNGVAVPVDGGRSIVEQDYGFE